MTEHAPAREAVIEAAAEPPPVSPGVRRLVLVAGIITTVLAIGGTALVPYLLVEHKLLLLVTSSDVRNVLLVASDLDLATVLAIGLPRRAFGMATSYGVGVVYGRAILSWSSKRVRGIGAFMKWFERVFARFGPLVVLIWPSYVASAMAGISRMRALYYVPAMLVAQAGFVIMAYTVGEAASEWVDKLVTTLKPYVLEATLVSASLVAVYQVVAYLRRRRKRARAAAAPPITAPPP